MKRPPLNPKISLKDFHDFYWLKSELVQFCKKVGIDSSGGKIQIAKRISTFLATGETTQRSSSATNRPTSKFNWHSTKLTLKSVITDNYKNSENVRAFFKKEIGPHFKFTVGFMNWIKKNQGKTLHDAIGEWKSQFTLRKNKTYKPDIAPQFEYNRYMRAFLVDNPGKTRKEAIKYWKLKRVTRGSKEYSKSDLLLG
jgi:hypothetical protein